MSQKPTVSANKRYYGESAKCYRCNINTVAFYYESDGRLCPKCKLELNPPKMSLDLFKTGQMWNSTLFCYEENMKLQDFITCGWFIKRKYIYYCDDAQRLCSVDLEYFGVAHCLRFSKHKFFTHGMFQCFNHACREENLFRKGPLRPSGGMFDTIAYNEMCEKNNPYRL